MGLSPLALDRPNQRILEASGNFGKIIDQKNQAGEESKSLGLQFDFGIFDSDELYAALDRMTWKQVAALRQDTLPGMKNLRKYLDKTVRLKARSGVINADAYNNELYELHKNFQASKAALAKEWERLRIAAVIGAGVGVGGVGVGAAGILGTVVGVPWADLLVKILGAGLVGVGTMKSELQGLIPARRSVKQHPLYFTEYLPGERS